jgi:hypothetical protein
VSEYKEGDTVTVTATGMVSQKTTSGYIVTIHGVDVPFVWINRGAPVAQQQELAQKMLDWIERTEREIAGDRKEFSLPDNPHYASGRTARLVEDIKQLCQEEVNRQ